MVAVSAAMLLVVATACGDTNTIEVPGETVVVEKEVVRTIEVPGQTVTKEVIKEVPVPGETVVVVGIKDRATNQISATRVESTDSATL